LNAETRDPQWSKGSPAKEESVWTANRSRSPPGAIHLQPRKEIGGGKGADVLYGGDGRDRADGGEVFDVCHVERPRRCEA